MKIINKFSQSWVSFDRSLMRDTRIKSNHKIIYLLFRSFAESCDNVFLSYSYIAKEIGYEYTGEFEKDSPQFERAMRKFVFENLQPLLDLGWIKKINNNGSSCDWEVYDHDCNPEPKSTETVNQKVQGNPEPKSTHSNKISSYKKLDLSLSTEQSEKTENLDWKSDILHHPLFERSRFIDFKDLDGKEIDYCLDLYKASLTNGRQPHFTQAVSWLKNHNRDKIKQKPSTYPTPPKKRLYEPSSKTNIDYSQGMVDGTVEEMREFFGIEN
jgi:hypothetical protein